MPCVRPQALTLIGAVLSILAFICNLIGLVGPSWYYVHLGEKGRAWVGLWDYCYSEPKYDCESYNQLAKEQHGVEGENREIFFFFWLQLEKKKSFTRLHEFKNSNHDRN